MGKRKTFITDTDVNRPKTGGLGRGGGKTNEPHIKLKWLHVYLFITFGNACQLNVCERMLCTAKSQETQYRAIVIKYEIKFDRIKTFFAKRQRVRALLLATCEPNIP